MQKLTIGIMREMSKGYNISALQDFLKDRDDDEVIDLLNRNDYIATKLWCEEDIKLQLEELGYDATSENVNKVLCSNYLKTLGDCTDQDWEIINQAIHTALD